MEAANSLGAPKNAINSPEQVNELMSKLKYLSNSYGISNINDFYGMATLKGNKATDIVGVQSINELEKILKESNVIN